MVVFVYFFFLFSNSLIDRFLHLFLLLLPTVPSQSNSAAPLSMMYNAEWLDAISRRAFSFHSWCLCVRALQTEGKLLLCQYLASGYLLLSLRTWLGKPTKHFMKYYIFSSVALFWMCFIWCARATPAGSTAELVLLDRRVRGHSARRCGELRWDMLKKWMLGQLQGIWDQYHVYLEPRTAFFFLFFFLH